MNVKGSNVLPSWGLSGLDSKKVQVLDGVGEVSLQTK